MNAPVHGRGYRVVLTGASGGIGRALANALAPHSASMLLVGRCPQRLHAAKSALMPHFPELQVETLAGDIASADTRERVADSARAFPRPVNLLINNAGINDFHAFDSQASSAIERLIEVNLLAPMLLAQRLLPLLRNARQAQIVNIGSVFGYLGYPGNCVYCATKFGLRGFSQALRRELADTGIAVRYFAPRATKTALNSTAVSALNYALKTKEDAPERVAQLFLRFLHGRAFERSVGIPERLYVFLNRLAPWVNDSAIRKQLRIINQYLPKSGPKL